MECIVCGKGISKKARTCGPTCRSKLARSVAKPSVAKPSVATPVASSVAGLEQCRYCGDPLPKLSRHRLYTGACYNCSLKAHPKTTVDDLWPPYRYTPYNEQTAYKMTTHEREHYKPACELVDGEHNPVSKPGDSHYR